MSSRNKLVIPEAQQAINDLKMEIAQDLGIPTLNGMTSNMYPALVNGLSVREMVRMGEQMLINKNTSKERSIY
ncbi:small, acid-soluble spore protein, alpha/beta type [Sedimentibacter sp. MB31-C6]|uniref:small, acid-soluble spore protein, alpha/beta type n=1 Tax=Sedimentibacter sp. MB31-C6 TaxID=3109366 RepID=UPI002DDDA480|nr:small, acid-soluble spore protein, alpha/beta type [Sedimentibacter sp. MB36-C1]WSI04683.1 small, acid-soluble spore protein, alpha/beta type [Sedimentibacter sp. MB36-C1]